MAKIGFWNIRFGSTGHIGVKYAHNIYKNAYQICIKIGMLFSDANF